MIKMTNNKKVVYTCISGPYDKLIELSERAAGWDYICFTDQNFKSDFWEIRPLPNGLSHLSQVKRQRYVKVMAHNILPEYDISLWIDGNMDITGDIDAFIAEKCSDGYYFYVGRHPFRDCIYDEMFACLECKKDTLEIMLPQIKLYERAGFPKHYGLGQTNILIRKHNNELCKKLATEWWNEIKNYSHRDQLSLTYVLWKNPDIQIRYMDSEIFFGNCFRTVFFNHANG